MVRLVLTVACMLCMAGFAAAADTVGGSWEDVTSLKPGQKVEIVDVRLKRHSGKFESATDESLTFNDGGSRTTLPRAGVYRLSTPGGKRLRNALIGLAVGTAIGTGAFASRYGWVYDGVPALAVGVVYGGAPGAGIGALVPGSKTVYLSTKP